MTSSAPAPRLLLLWIILALSGCECGSRDRDLPHAPVTPRVEVTGEPVVHDGSHLLPAQREQAAELTALIKQYYPRWQRERESMDDYLVRYHESPEIARFRAHIENVVEHDDTWGPCLREIQDALRGKFFVQNGTPPRFYIPSFQVVLSAPYRGGHVAIVFRISMLAPLFDYYELVTDATGRKRHMSLTPTRDTLPIARVVGGILGRYFPDHRELPPEVSTVRVRDMHISGADISGVELDADYIGDVSLADALFEGGRTWW